MAKPALGRNLGNLLGETRGAASAEKVIVPVADSSQAVGSGLETLLRGNRAETAVEDAPILPNPNPDSVSVLAEPEPLATEHAQETITPHPAIAERPTREELETPFRFPRWLLLTADGALVVMAALLAFKSPIPLKTWETGVCMVAVLLGGLLALSAVLFTKNK
ncbi:MAG: hypothetical protein WCO56_09630 [Verrucomicrobiota bacterium]